MTDQNINLDSRTSEMKRQPPANYRQVELEYLE
jgi:hypothetical protein